MSIRLFFVMLVAILIGARAPTSAASAPGAASMPASTPTPIALFVLSSGSTQAQRCAVQSPQDEATYGAALYLISKQKESPAPVAFPTVAGIDPKVLIGAQPGTKIIVASYCKSGDVLNFTLTGYAPAPPPATLPNTGSVSGTLDGLWASDWSGLFGALPLPLLVPNVAFYPVANDTTNIVNPRIEANLPVTQLQTPGPAPTVTPAPGTPPIPTTRLDACRQSPNRVLIAGRIVVLSNPSADDIGKLLVGAAGLKLSQPSPWGGIYGAAGIALGALYGPNRAEVGADVFYCPSESELYWVGGQSITGHATTPLFNPSPEQVQRALDLATTDLENQLACILHHVPYGKPDDPDTTHNVYPTIPDLSPTLTNYCDGDKGYWHNLLTDAQKKFPSQTTHITIAPREPGPPANNGPIDAGVANNRLVGARRSAGAAAHAATLGRPAYPSLEATPPPSPSPSPSP